MTPPTIIVCGVSGSGKTAVGRALAEALGYAFLDADDLHDPAAVSKMARGEPLDDADRAPWLARVAAAAARVRAAGEGVVVACSALKLAHRDALRQAGAGTAFVMLQVPAAEAARRIVDRPGHFMTASLIPSQFEALETPGPDEAGMIVIDGSATPGAAVSAVVRALG